MLFSNFNINAAITTKFWQIPANTNYTGDLGVTTNTESSVTFTQNPQPDYATMDTNPKIWNIEYLTKDPSIHENKVVSISSSSLTFSSQQSFDKIILSTDAFNDKDIRTVNFIFNTSTKSAFNFSVRVGNVSKTKPLSNNTSYTETFDSFNDYGEIEITIENSTQNNITFSFSEIRITYTDLNLKQSEIKLPVIESNNNTIEWTSTLNFGGEGDPMFNTEIDPSNIEFEIKPLFDPVYPPSSQSLSEDSDPSDNYSSETENNNPVDGYFSFEPYASLNNDGQLSLNFPCSGIYEVTMRTKPNAPGIAKASTTQIYNICPSFKGLSINWQPIDLESSAPTIIYMPELKNVYVALDAQLLTVYYKVWNSSTIMRAIDNEYLAPSIPQDFKPLTGRGIDLSEGDFISLYLKKNNSVAGPHIINYSLSDVIPTLIEEINIPDSCNYRWYDLNGFPVNPEYLEKGIYIRIDKISGKPSKIIF